MSTEPQQLLDVALSLPESDRANIAASLLRSLDAPNDPGADAAWATEIERRIRSIDDGSTKLVAWDDVMTDMQQRRNA